MNPRAIRFAALGAMGLGLSLTAHADTFGSGDNAFTIDFVDIGNAGNADDKGAGGGRFALGFGRVSYVYRMGVTEVPQDWITKATNLGLTNVTAGTWSGLQPAANMTWFEAAAFVNWLNTSNGHQAAYQLNASNTTLTLWSSAQAWQLGGENLYRHKDAYYFLPSMDEWYKAAYHQNDGVTANYWDYATGSNTIPDGVDFAGDSNYEAVFNDGYFLRVPNMVTDVGSRASAYGTYGQTGNVSEWHETAVSLSNNSSSESRWRRGGDYTNTGDSLSSGVRGLDAPSFSRSNVGFRVASVPEPSCAILMLSGSLLALARRRRAAV